MKRIFLLLCGFAFLGFGCSDDNVDYQKKLMENADKWQAQVLACPQADYDEDDELSLQEKVDEYKKDFYPKCYKEASDVFDCVLEWGCPQLLLFTDAQLGIDNDDSTEWMGDCSKLILKKDNCIEDASNEGDDDEDDE